MAPRVAPRQPPIKESTNLKDRPYVDIIIIIIIIIITVITIVESIILILLSSFHFSSFLILFRIVLLIVLLIINIPTHMALTNPPRPLASKHVDLMTNLIN